MVQKILSTHSVFGLLLTASTCVLAETEAETTLNAVSVKDRVESATGPVPGYVVKRASSATKTDTPLRETPQAVTVITADQIADQGALNLQDALNYAAGVRSDAYGLDSRTDSVRIRGAYPDEYLDGLRQTFNWYTSTSRVDPYALERIEVLRGPSAMLFGQGSTAGVVNEVSKRPLAEAQHEIGIKAGSNDLKQIQTDLTGPLTEDGRWLYRIVALAREAQTQVDYVDDDRKLLAPSLTWRPDDKFELTLQLRWQDDKSGSTSQFFPWEGNVTSNPNGRIPTNRFIGEPGFDRYNSERFTAGWLLGYQINERWSLQQNVRYTRNEVDYRTLYADSFSNPENPFIDSAHRVMGRWGGVTQPLVKMIATDQHLEGLIKTGAIEHQLLVGVDALRFNQTGKEKNESPIYYPGGTVPNIDIYSPTYTGFAITELDKMPEQTERQLGVYLQDQIKIDRHWIVVAGVRHDRASSEIEGTDDADTSATSKRLGLMYAADNGLSPYLSYSESFTPVVNSTIEGHPKPLRGKQWEVGVKYQPVDKNINLGLTLYDLREQNQVVALTPLLSAQTGETKTTGAELEARAGLGNFELIAHYNYTDIDDALEAVPKNQAAVWGKWYFSAFDISGFSFGTGARYLSAFKDGIAPTTPSVTLLDALAAWDTAQWRFAVNANNLADKTYYSTCLSRGDCWIGARRNIVASATYRW